MNEVKLWFPFPVQVKERARFRSRKRGGPYTPEKTVQFERSVRERWNEVKHSFDGLPVGVHIDIHKDGFYVTVFELAESVRPTGILGDIDNYVKSILDGLQPHKFHVMTETGENIIPAFTNDRQVELVQVRFVGVPRTTRVSRRKQ